MYKFTFVRKSKSCEKKSWHNMAETKIKLRVFQNVNLDLQDVNFYLWEKT